MTGIGIVLATTFLASSVEAIEMVTIVIGVGVTRGWRSTLIGTAAGFALLAVTIGVLGLALTRIPISPLRVLVGTVLLLFGLQWFRKGIVRVAARGLAGYQGPEEDDEDIPEHGLDWIAFTLAFKGVLLEGLEVVFIVVTFGASAGHLGPAIAAGTAAVVLIGGVGLIVHPLVSRIPRSLLQLIVGTLLTSFGTFWALEGLGVTWPQSDLDIALLVVFYALFAAVSIARERRPRLAARQPASAGR
ncbi:MAG TPA: hypothetical protein VF137_10650 [Candidatus Dormibacteraeota bacterium]